MLALVFATYAADLDALESERMSMNMDVVLEERRAAISIVARFRASWEPAVSRLRVTCAALAKRAGALLPAIALAAMLWGGFALSAQAQNIVEYVHTDALGSPVATSDAAGNIIERQVYEPYGATITHGPTDGPGFTGHVEDSVTSLTYMQQRYYDPDIGRFLSVDPIAASLGPNFSRYAYAANNPYRFTDPDGRDCRSKDGTTTCTIPITGSKIPAKISFPTPEGVSGEQTSSSPAYHKYNYPTPHSKSDKSVQKAIADDPTPGDDKPATPTGTKNNATPDGARGVMARLGGALGNNGDSPVKSYTATHKGNTWTINVTQPGHGLHFGYVLRGSVDGTAMSVGEGWGWPQAVPGLAGYINDVWEGHNQKNIDNAK